MVKLLDKVWFTTAILVVIGVITEVVQIKSGTPTDGILLSLLFGACGSFVLQIANTMISGDGAKFKVFNLCVGIIGCVVGCGLTLLFK